MFKFDPKNPDKLEKNKEMLIEHFYKGFGYTFKGGDLKSIVNQAKKLEGEALRAAVQVKQKLFHKYREDEDGNKTAELIGIIIVDYAEIYYVGRITDDLKMKQEKRYIKLSQEDLLKYEDHVKAHPERYDENGRLKNEETNEQEQESGYIRLGRLEHQ